MSATADSLAYKADVKARTKEKVVAKKDAVVAKVRDAAPHDRDEAVAQASDVAKRAGDAVRANPQVAAGVGGLALLLGLGALWRSRRSARRTAALSASQRAPRRR